MATPAKKKAAAAVGAAASAAAILRAAQKDEVFLRQLHAAVADVLQRTKGSLFYLRHHGRVTLLTEALYMALTTLSLRQTLGEEYTGLLMVDRDGARLPSMLSLHSVVWMQVLGPSVGRFLLRLLRESLSRGFLHSYLRPELSQGLLARAGGLQEALTLIQRLHLAAFFLKGAYYHLAKRLVGATYVSVRPWLNDHTTDGAIRHLGQLVLLQVSVSVLRSLYNLYTSCSGDSSPTVAAPAADKVTDADAPGEETCRLCLCSRAQPTLCPCGHVFCWGCIHTALAANGERCPLCRYEVTPRDLIPLKNFK